MKEESGGRMMELYRERVEKLACAFPINENYFAWQAFGRCYDIANKEAMPEYLREDNFATLRTNVDRVETHITSLGEYLKNQPESSLNRFILLDSQDWMPPQVIHELWSEIARVGQSGSRIIFRTAGEVSPVDSALGDLGDRFTSHPERAAELHEQDRSAIYGMFHIYTLDR